MRFPFLLPLLVLLGTGCAWVGRSAPEPRTGPWRMELVLGAERLPFLFDMEHDGRKWSMLIHNGEETIRVDDIVRRGDSLRMRMPLFDSEFVGVLLDDSTISGLWHNYLKGPDYAIPFTARAGSRARFPGKEDAGFDPSGNWRVAFSKGSPDAYDAIGLFHGQGAHATGTFGTETGDYRFLDGSIQGDSLFLSAFDGSHAFLFKAAHVGDSLVGRFWSGTHWQEPWVAVRESEFRLRNPDSLTVLREGHDMVDFSFPSIDGGVVSPKDVRHAGNVLMVQVMGSWCPNCVDETLLLDEVYTRYHEKGLDVIAVAFEKYAEPEKAIAALRRFRDRLDVKYDIVYAGEARKEVAGERLPFLEHIMSYPTCIFIDRAGKVRRIRTGFYGPGTGEHYLNYKRNLMSFIEHLLNEPEPAQAAL